jgi:chromosome segregation ATPase
VGGLQEKVAKYETEVGAQCQVLASLTHQREEAQRGNTDAVERAQLLASEVVALEEKCRSLTSRELKAKHELERMAEELDRATRSAKQVCDPEHALSASSVV